MAGWNGSGVFTRLHNWVTDKVAGTKIIASRMDGEFDNYKEGLENCRTLDGQNNPSADLPMATQKHTNVGAATARTNYAQVAQVQDSDYTHLGNVAGTDTITADASPAITAYAAGQRFHFVAAGTNTGAATIDINSIAAKAIQKNGAALVAGDITSGDAVELVYDGTQFQMTSPARTPVLTAGGIAGTGVAAASDTARGTVELATDAEVATGTDTARAVTPAGLYASGPWAHLPRSEVTDDVTIGATHRGRMVVLTTATGAVDKDANLPAAASNAGFVVGILNEDADDAFIIDPNASELVDGEATVSLAQDEWRVLWCDGTGWISIASSASGGASDVQTFDSSDTWTKPASGTVALLEAWAAGGSGIVYSNGGGGGGGGAYTSLLLPLSALGATESVTIGAGGAGKAAEGAGNVGGNTTIGAHLTAYGGGAPANDQQGGGGGGGNVAAGGAAAGGGIGGGAQGNPAGGNGGGGGGGDTGAVGGRAYYGGGGGGGGNSGGIAGEAGGASLSGGGGGGGGTNGTVGAGGASTHGGNGGAGGSSAGVDGTQPGGGGGGSTSGTSGAGGDGRARVTVW